MSFIPNYTRRVRITVDHTKVGSDVNNFPIYVDLANLPADFHTNVNQTDGRDIRVTMNDGITEVPREVVFYDSSTDTGALHFKGNISSTHETTFFIYYGNASASDYATSATYGAQKVWTEFTSTWHLQQTGNGTASEFIDSTVNVMHGRGGAGTGTKVPTKVTGKVGSGQLFDGTDDYIDIGDSSIFDFGGGDFTLAAWVKRASNTTRDVVIGKDIQTAGQRQFMLILLDTGGNSFARVSYLTPTDAEVYLDSNVGISDTNWHYVVGVRSGNSFIMYVDGAQAGSGTTSGTHGTMQSTTANVQLGRREYSGFTDEMAGTLDEIKIAPVALSAGWISTEYNNQNSPSTFYAVGAVESNGGSTINSYRWVTVGDNMSRSEGAT